MEHLLSTCYVPDTDPGSSRRSSHLILVTSPTPVTKIYYSHFTDGETELRKVMPLALGHTADNWFKRKLNTVCQKKKKSSLSSIKPCASCVSLLEVKFLLTVLF